MTTAFVLGNGLSRRELNLSLLKSKGSVYGCNAIYREFEPDCLVATDRPIAQRIQETGYSASHRFYTRRPIAGKGALAVPKKYYGNSSGPIAAAIAAIDGNSQIYLIGFDMGPTASNKFNNMYAGTEFYKAKDASPTFTGNWIRQVQQLCKDFENVQFIRILGDVTAEINDLKSINNLAHMHMEDFIRGVINV